MHLAVRHNFPALVQLLIDAGSDLDATDNVSGCRNHLGTLPGGQGLAVIS